MNFAKLSRFALWSSSVALLGRLAAAAAADGSRRLVLVVDDDRLVCESMIEMLDLEGQTGVAVHSGRDAIDTFRRRQGEIGLVLLDLSMPGMDGLATLKALREIDGDVRVVLVSGYEQDEALRQFAAHRISGFLQKPFDFKDFVALIDAFL